MLNIFNLEFWKNSLFSFILILAAVVALPEIIDWIINSPWENKKGQAQKSNRPEEQKSKVSFKEYALNVTKYTIIVYLGLIVLGIVLLIAAMVSKSFENVVKTGLLKIPKIDYSLNVSFLNYYLKFSLTWLIILILLFIGFVVFRTITNVRKKTELMVYDPVKETPKNLITGSLSVDCPPISLLNTYGSTQIAQQNEEMKARLQQCFNEYELNYLSIVKVETGPTITRFTVRMDTSGRLGAVLKIEKEMSMYLGVESISISSSANGIVIDVPNKIRSNVSCREVLELFAQKKNDNLLCVPLGKTAVGNLQAVALNEAPHLLIAGATGSGKSVCINEIIVSILFNATPEEVRFIFVDPKVVEMSCYNGIPHLLAPVVTDPLKATIMLDWAVQEMEERYKRLAAAGVRNITAFNEKAKKKSDKMPFIIIVIDELADLMLVAKKNKNRTENSVEESIQRLGQKARAAGIHLIVGTQRPSADVITGTIKTNIPARIAFTVTSGVDSRIILDTNGAEKLLGKGDGLLLTTGSPIRFQSAFISDAEVERVVEWWKEKNSGIQSSMIDLEKLESSCVDQRSKDLISADNTPSVRKEANNSLNQTISQDDYYMSVRRYIAKLASGDEEDLYLPSTRQVEEELGINHRYVVESLQKMVSEGWIEKVGESPRTMRYRVLLSQDDALLALEKNAI